MNIAKLPLIGLLAVSAAVCAAASANAGFDPKSLRYFASVDLFDEGTAENRFKNFMDDNVRAGNNGSYSDKAETAVAGRVGALYPVKDLADVGLSWGYISGPKAKIKLDGLKYTDVERRMYRFLAEGRKKFALTDKVSFLGGIGAGIGFGRTENALETPTVVNGVTLPNEDKYFHGFTWELSAGAAYRATEKLDVELGVRYAGFPRCKQSPAGSGGNITGSSWNAFGLFAGVSF